MTSHPDHAPATILHSDEYTQEPTAAQQAFNHDLYTAVMQDIRRTQHRRVSEAQGAGRTSQTGSIQNLFSVARGVALKGELSLAARSVEGVVDWDREFQVGS